MARDNFSTAAIEKLKARVAHRCSNPSCRVPTSAPSENNKVNNIGIAAHICAASPGGPRYDGEMTIDERKSINNAIWLCSNCSIDIDKDVGRYSVDILKGWKRKAEATARLELGKRLPSNNETIDTVAAALTGFPKNYISTAISNVHQATEKALENLDPRFLVKTSHGDGKTFIGIHAKENVQFSMKVNGEIAKQYLEKYRQLFEHGKDLVINSDSIAIEGSKLLEEIFGATKGVLSISSHKVEATQKLWLVQKNTNLMEFFDDILGVVSFGTKSFNFEGSACNKLFNLRYQKLLDEDDGKANITMSLCLDQWEGVCIKFLPFFEKLYSLFKKMSEGWELFTSLEVKGVRVVSSKGMCVSEWNYIIEIASFLHYVARSRVVINLFKCDIGFTSNISCTAEEYDNICDIASIVEGKKVYDKDSISGNVICDLIVDKNCENIAMLKKIDQPSTIKVVQNEGEKISIFGKRLTLPSKFLILDYVIPKIKNKLESLKEGDVISVEWMPQDNFRCTIGYES